MPFCRILQTFLSQGIRCRIRPVFRLSLIHISKEQRVFPDPFDTERVPKLIEELGGVDIAFGGIGINGHVAFNEADASLANEEFLAQKTRCLLYTSYFWLLRKLLM